MSLLIQREESLSVLKSRLDVTVQSHANRIRAFEDSQAALAASHSETIARLKREHGEQMEILQSSLDSSTTTRFEHISSHVQMLAELRAEHNVREQVLRVTIAQLRTEAHDLQGRLAAATASGAECEGRLSSLLAQHAEAVKRTSVFQISHVVQLEELTSARVAAELRVRELQAELDEVKTQASDVLTQRAEAADRSEAIQSLFAGQIQQMVSAHTAELETIGQQLTDVREELSSAQSDLSESRLALQHCQSDLSEERTVIQTLSAETQLLSDVLAAVRNDHAQQMASILTRHKTQSSDLQAEVGALQDKHRMQLEQLDIVRTENASLVAIIKGSKERLEITLQEKINDLHQCQEQLAIVQVALDSASKRVSALEDERHTMLQERDLRTAQHERDMKTLQTQEQTQRKLAAKHSEEMQLQLKATTELLKSLEFANERQAKLQSALTASQVETKALQGQLQSIRLSHSEAMDESTRRSAALRQTIGDNERVIAAHEEALSQQSDDLLTVRRNLSDCETRTMVLEQEQARLLQALEKSRANLDSVDESAREAATLRDAETQRLEQEIDVLRGHVATLATKSSEQAIALQMEQAAHGVTRDEFAALNTLVSTLRATAHAQIAKLEEELKFARSDDARKVEAVKSVPVLATVSSAPLDSSSASSLSIPAAAAVASFSSVSIAPVKKKVVSVPVASSLVRIHFRL